MNRRPTDCGLADTIRGRRTFAVVARSVTEAKRKPLTFLAGEVYAAIDAGLLALPLMGARAAFDRAMFLLVGDPPGGFTAKLEAMKAKERLTDRDLAILKPMIDAGSAAAHRGWLPNADVLAKS